MDLVKVSSGKVDPRPALEGSLWSPLFAVLTLYPFLSNGAIKKENKKIYIHIYEAVYIYLHLYPDMDIDVYIWAKSF